MSRILSRIKNNGKATLALLVIIGAAFGLTIFLLPAQEADDDGDGIGNAYETFFSVNYTNPAGPALSPVNALDASLDFDRDGLSNLQEFQKNADPFNPDTDGDGFKDSTDTNPVSRANLKWGNPFWLTTNGEYNVIYAQPRWLIAAVQDGGTWATTNVPTSWYVSPATADDTGRLSVMVDRAVITNDMRLKIKLYDSTNSTLFLDLVDAKAVVVATNFSGNVLSGTASIVTTNISVPFGSYPNAVSVEMRRGTGEITVYESQLYCDIDGDGLDSDQEKQLGTSDYVWNSWPGYLTVNNGQGSGWYVSGHPATISANAAAIGQVFNTWMGDIAKLDDRFSATAALTMPAANATLTPSYIVIQPAQGMILRDVYTGISGNAIINMTTNAAFPDYPLQNMSTTFEAPANWADNYGTRMRGYVHPPTTGYYSFWIATDDNGQLWLSSDDNPDNKALIASVPGCTGYRAWTTYAAQHSVTFHLEAGRKYYIEALQKEGGGGDNLSVAWTGPGFSQAVIDGAYLSPVDVVLRTPENPTNVAQGVNYQYYEGNWGGVLPNFDLLTPVDAGYTTAMDLGPILSYSYFGLKFTGYIDVPTDGWYTFFTTSDDGSKLYIGNRLVLNNDGSHGMVEQSGMIALKAGKHAITTVMFQGAGGYGLEVRYSGPGIAKQLVPASVLYRQGVAKVALAATELAIHLPFDETTGLIANDVSSNENTGVLLKMHTNDWTTGYLSNALAFDGSNEFVRVSPSDSINAIGASNADFSVAFWVYPAQDAYGQWRNLVHKGDADGQRTFAMWMHPWDNGVHFRVSTVNNGNEGGDSSTALPLNTWTHVAYVKRANTLCLYFNGVRNAGVTLSGDTVGNTGPLFIGKDRWYRGLCGKIDEFVVYNRAVNTIDGAFLGADIWKTSVMRDPDNPTNVVPGLEYKYFQGYGSSLADYAALSPVRMNATTNFNIDLRLRNEGFAFQYAGYIDVPTDGAYTFYTTSDDGSALYIGGQQIVNNDGLHGMVERSGKIGLRAGKHAINVGMFQNYGGYGLSVSYSGPGISKQVIPSNVLYRQTNPVTLTVNGGTGSGAFEAGWTVNIAAGQSPSGTVFDTWVGETSSVFNVYGTATMLTMPSSAITVTANFIPKVTGSILREVWLGISGNGLDSLFNSYLYPDAPSFWTNALSLESPVNWADNYGTKMCGYLYPPVTGDYTFYIATDDYGQLWLSPDGNPANKTLIAWINGWAGYRQWTVSTSQKSAVLHLEAGRRYYIEALQKEGGGLDNLSVAWTGPVGTDTNVIAGAYLSPIVIDSDGNGLRDVWEMQYFGALGQNPNADPDHDGLSNLQESRYNTNPFKADTDGDGISDYDEVMIYRSNPTKCDGDGDGMPDWWEIAHGLNPLVNDAALDPDGDGLSNLDEYRAGTDPQKADTDGDGVNDYIEVKQAFSDPLMKDFNGVVTDLQTINGSAIAGSLGSWTKAGSMIYARERSGYLEYSITAPEAGIFAVRADVTQHNGLTTQSMFDLSLSIDGKYSGRYILNAPYGTVKGATFFLPRISAGTHTIRIRWRNMAANTFLQVNSVRLQNYGGTDINANGIPDWQENRLSRISGMTTPPSTSLISPVCLEGESYYPATVAVIPDFVPDGVPQVIAVNQGLNNDWFANVRLSPTNDTQIQVLDQDGAASYSNLVTWLPLNILDGIYTNYFPVRLGDSLKLMARPLDATGGTIAITIRSGAMVVTNVMTTVDQPFIYKFNQAGAFTVNGAFNDESLTTNLTMTVNVISASFSADPVCVIGMPRTWDCPNIPSNVVIEADVLLQVAKTNLPAGGSQFTLLNNCDIALGVIARISTGGAILDNAKVSSVNADNGNYGRVISSYADGSRLVEVRLQLGEVPPDIQVKLSIFVGGVTFDDGTLSKTLTAADFDELGVATYYLVQVASSMTSVCHHTQIYQGAKYIGGN